jgi:hypothetical protein
MKIFEYLPVVIDEKGPKSAYGPTAALAKMLSNTGLRGWRAISIDWENHRAIMEREIPAPNKSAKKPARRTRSAHDSTLT